MTSKPCLCSSDASDTTRASSLLAVSPWASTTTARAPSETGHLLVASSTPSLVSNRGPTTPGLRVSVASSRVPWSRWRVARGGSGGDVRNRTRPAIAIPAYMLPIAMGMIYPSRCPIMHETSSFLEVQGRWLRTPGEPGRTAVSRSGEPCGHDRSDGPASGVPRRRPDGRPGSSPVRAWSRDAPRPGRGPDPMVRR
jgi:hypothetical protein